jgi:DNA-binding response OmpR family regulator
MARILIVDDDQLAREATRIALKSKGHDVTLAASGKAGVELAIANDFDAAIVDLFMPDMDGLAVIKAIHDVKPSLPLIVASGFMFGGGECPQMPNFESMAAEAGAVATLYKPLRPATLFAQIEALMASASPSPESAFS